MAGRVLVGELGEGDASRITAIGARFTSPVFPGETLTTLDDNLQIARWRVQAGLASSLDEQQARTLRATTAATIPTLERSYRSALARLAVLTGQAPGALDARLEAAGARVRYCRADVRDDSRSSRTARFLAVPRTLFSVANKPVR